MEEVVGLRGLWGAAAVKELIITPIAIQNRMNYMDPNKHISE